ncbi:MAG TPA: MFS transporter [Ktedonobacteraceae bacterium]|nr:MFS transporter [Ktedonobacteraceae bacterium]
MQRRAALLAVLAASAAVFLTALDQTVVVTALPRIIVDLQIPVTQLDRAAWIISGYLLGYVVAMPLMGRVSDMYGRRRVFITCLCIFALGSLFCALAPVLGDNVSLDFLQGIGIDVSSPGLIWLVAARFVQAAGGGAVVPVAMAVAGDFYGEKRRGLALGLIGMVTEAGGVLGPLYGSVIVQYGGFSIPLGSSILQTSGWQTIFYLNLPIVAVLLVFIWRLVPPGKLSFAGGQETINTRQRVDLPGALLLGASLVCLSLGLSQEAAQVGPAASGPGSAPIQNNPWLIAAALVLLATFIAFEIYAERVNNRAQVMQRLTRVWPIVEPSLFKRVTFSAAALASLLVGTALIIAMVDIPIFVATVLGRPAIDSGLALLRLTAMIPIGALIGGWLCSIISCRLTALLGLVPTAIGFWLMHLWPLDVGWTQITISTLIGGLGFGLVIAPIGTTAINGASSRQIGMASSVVTVLRMVGMILGLAALTSWGLGRFRALAAAFKPPPGVPAFSATYNTLYGQYLVVSAHEVYTAIFLAAGVLCIVALVPAFFLEGRKPSPYFVRNTGDDTYFTEKASS